LLDCKRRWGQWRAYYVTPEGVTAHVPAGWTDAGPKDPFVEQARGRALARIEDLMALARMTERTAKRNTP
jgi:hypothetical protein